MLKKSIVFLFFIVSSLTIANELEILERAFKKIDYDKNLFSYMSVTEENNGKEINITKFSFDPNSKDLYDLISINNEKPTKKQYKNFLKEQEKRNGDDENDDFIFGEEYKLESVSNGIAHFTYITQEDMIPKKDSKMNGEIWCDLENEEIKRLVVKNKDKINIIVGFAITSFNMELIFTPFNSELSVVTQMNLDITGKAFVANFNQISKSSLSEYKLVK